ncbi:MAG: hypothetical protein A3J55_04340 [Candidatus Ryanbacteria bacterium RIFCSPHIGHO2_02_FULL_45_17b]|uniref:Uncharacterized protein n=1 Tax=Candidatus Ryanbacteria bacterium RIFCSPHIGHO2_01_FULL_45_22 TaxID=1802114 RepID=A0A1G2G293_9BACT|nr:MAG: hypothetical protein A2719_04915 [Candidatus Ryanbacteria bacterium RIFCSPHIGHO2_01_FULL_45_22]OGZ47575.1 MAG: hypothetical protein A3J55_04340 [Candidatus Ryanbacteria bacterium RIFCSPHIGHO2_02_FULL_45_17b]
MKVFVMWSDGEQWSRSRFSVVWGETAYMIKTFRQCGWVADFVLEGTYMEDADCGRTFEVESVLEGADDPLLPFVIRYLRCS